MSAGDLPPASSLLMFLHHLCSWVLLYQAQEESGRYASEADLTASALGAPSQLTVFSWLVPEQAFSLLPSHPGITPKSKPRARSSLQALSLLGASLPNRKALQMPPGGEQAVTNGDLGTQGCGTSCFPKAPQAPHLVGESAAAPQQRLGAKLSLERA